MEGFVTCSIAPSEHAYLLIGDLWFYIDKDTPISCENGQLMLVL